MCKLCDQVLDGWAEEYEPVTDAENRRAFYSFVILLAIVIAGLITLATLPPSAFL